MPTTSPELELASPPPRYQLAAQRIRKLIRAKGLRAGDSLPSERDLARTLAMPHHTIRMANDLLMQKGWVVREHGRGTFVGQMKGHSQINHASQFRGSMGYLAIGNELQGYTLSSFRRMQEFARKNQYRLVFGNVAEQDPNVLPQNFIDERVDAFVVDGFLDENILSQLRQVEIPFVVAGNHAVLKNISHARVDYFELYRQFVLHLAQAGHTTIWMAMSTVKLYYMQEMMEGYRQGMKDAGVFPELCILAEHELSETIADQVAGTLERFGPRQALILGAPILPVLKLLEKRGLDMNQLDIVSPQTGHIAQTPSWVNEIPMPNDLVTDAASRMILERLNNKPQKSINIVPSVTSGDEAGHVKLAVQWDCREETKGDTQ